MRAIKQVSFSVGNYANHRIFHSGQQQVNGHFSSNLHLKTTLHSKEELEWGKTTKILSKELMKYGAILLRGFSFHVQRIWRSSWMFQLSRMPYVGGAAPCSQVTKGRY